MTQPNSKQHAQNTRITIAVPTAVAEAVRQERQAGRPVKAELVSDTQFVIGEGPVVDP